MKQSVMSHSWAIWRRTSQNKKCLPENKISKWFPQPYPITCVSDPIRIRRASFIQSESSNIGEEPLKKSKIEFTYLPTAQGDDISSPKLF
jgi:hypothetical protein